MIQLDKKYARIFSRLGQRGTICGKALLEIMDDNSDSVVLTADLATLSGLDRVKTEFPERFYNVGIAEQNLIGVAAGMAFAGDVPFVTTYATFITMRCYEQIRHNLGYQSANVKIIGSSAGFAMGMSGNTHYTYEDISIMRSIPGMVVLSPADAGEAYMALHASAKHKGPVYIRLTGGLNTDIIYNDAYDYIIGKGIEHRHGEDVAIFATGTIVATAIKVADYLEERDGISVTVIDMHTIKPLDIDIINAQKRMRLVVSLEEHSVLGGLGSAIAEVISKEINMPRLISIGVEDCFLKPDSYENMLLKAHLDCESVYLRIKEELQSNR